jgi:hypothetical protein
VSDSGRLRGALRFGIACAIVLGLFILDTRLFGGSPRNADTFSSYLVALDMAHGNWRLAGWSLSQDNFLTSDVLAYAVLIRLLGENPAYVLYLSVCLWLATGVAAYLLARRGADSPAWAALPPLILLGLPMFHHNPVMVLITSCPMHIGSILYVCALFLVADAIRVRRGLPALVLSCVLGLAAAAGVAGDPLVLFVGVLPLIAASVLPLDDQPRQRYWLAAPAAVGAAAGRIAVLWNARSGGFTTVTDLSSQMVFVPFDDLAHNVSLAAQSLLRLFGADFFGYRVGAAIPALVRLPLVVMAAGLVLAVALEWYRRDCPRALVATRISNRFLDTLLVIAIVVNIGIATFSRLLVDQWSARFLLPTLVFAAILLGRRAPRRAPVAIVYVIALCVSLVVDIRGYAHTSATPAIAAPRAAALAQWLSARAMTDGFGPYWTASVVTAMSRGQTRLRAVVKNEQGQLVPYLWVSRADWYPVPLDSRKPFFVVIDPTEDKQPLYDQGSVEHAFGAPSETHAIERYVVYLYR